MEAQSPEQEVGTALGAPTPPNGPQGETQGETQTEWQAELETQTQTQTETETQQTQTETQSQSEIPPPPQGAYAVPPGYAQNPPPTFVPTQLQVEQSAPRRIRVRVRDGTQVPADARVYQRRSKFLLIPGVIAFGVSYAISLSGAIAGDEGLLYAPFVGPLLWQLDEGNSDTAGLMVLLTLAQTAGAFLFGFGMRKKTYAEWHVGGDRRLAVAAVPTRRGAALSLRVW